MAEDVLFCRVCGAAELDPDYADEHGLAICDECSDTQSAQEFLTLFEDRRPEQFREDLHSEALRHGGCRENMVQQLIVEADEAASRGDVDLGVHYLRFAARPKFNSTEECQQQYDEAMGRAVA